MIVLLLFKCIRGDHLESHGIRRGRLLPGNNRMTEDRRAPVSKNCHTGGRFLRSKYRVLLRVLLCNRSCSDKQPRLSVPRVIGREGTLPDEVAI
jgi:hypothetical protein